MDSQMTKLGTSLLVPSVHELAKQPMTKVPERYVRLNQDPVVSDTISLPQVPVIDLNKLFSEDGTELINHGVNPLLVQNVKIGVQEFFGLQMEEKRKLWQKQGELEGNDLESYSLELGKLSIAIIKLISKALEINTNELLELFEDLSQSMRMNCYPPCPQPEHVIGLNPHSDAGALTILLQVNEMEGLQIRKDGMWIPIKPLSNAFVINVGDILEILTNGIYRSVEHRATINAEKERISIATFHRPQMNRIVGPTPSLVTPERPALFKRIGVADYYRGYFSRELRGKSYIDVIKIKNT
ncbi:hypothetical protein JHK85_000738 [Glycine max]|nr:hypothetical protein JHK85_000738 [Glycine max]